MLHFNTTESRPRVMLSPSGVVPVCPESRISFRCSTNLTFLEWIVTVPQSGRLNSKSEIVTAETLLDLDLDIGGHVFHINRNSAYNSYPLESVLTIANATTTLMATKINCTERSFNERSSSIAIIDIINSRLMNENCKSCYHNIFYGSPSRSS